MGKKWTIRSQMIDGIELVKLDDVNGLLEEANKLGRQLQEELEICNSIKESLEGELPLFFKWYIERVGEKCVDQKHMLKVWRENRSNFIARESGGIH